MGTRLAPKHRRKSRRQKFGHLAGHGGAARRLLHFRAPRVRSVPEALNPRHTSSQPFLTTCMNARWQLQFWPPTCAGNASNPQDHQDMTFWAPVLGYRTAIAQTDGYTSKADSPDWTIYFACRNMSARATRECRCQSGLQEGWMAYQRARTTADVVPQKLATAVAEASSAGTATDQNTGVAPAAVQAGEVDPAAQHSLWLFLPERRLKTDAAPEPPTDLQLWRTKRRRAPPPAGASLMSSAAPRPAQLESQAHVEFTAQQTGENEGPSGSGAFKARNGHGGLRVALRVVSRALRGKQRRRSSTS